MFINIIIYFENVHFFHAMLGLDICPYEVPPHIPQYHKNGKTNKWWNNDNVTSHDLHPVMTHQLPHFLIPSPLHYNILYGLYSTYMNILQAWLPMPILPMYKTLIITLFC